MAEHATHFKDHLRVCKTYIQRIITKVVQARNPFNVSSPAIANQSTINFPRLSKNQKTELDIQAVMWCFMSNHSFRMFENSFGKRFLQALNPAYTPPSRKAVSGALLDSAYIMTKTRVDELIAALSNINVVTDESSNISDARICNISVHSPSGVIHYVFEDIDVKQMNAITAAQ